MDSIVDNRQELYPLTEQQFLEDAQKSIEMMISQQTESLRENYQAIEKNIAELRKEQDRFIQSKELYICKQSESKGVFMPEHRFGESCDAIQDASEKISVLLNGLFSQIPLVISSLPPSKYFLFIDLLKMIQKNEQTLDEKDKVILKKKLAAELRLRGEREASMVAESCIELGIYKNMDILFSILKGDNQSFIVDFCLTISQLKKHNACIRKTAMLSSKILAASI